jgi:glutamate-1-semialdehyde 2,1-aminomutase
MAYPDPRSRSAALHARACRVLPDGGSRSTTLLRPYPLFIDQARGAEVVDVDGNVYLDFINNYTSLIHGHAHPGISAAVERQLRRGTAYSFCNESEIELAELLCGRNPNFDRIRFMNSGSEAVMNAIKAARAFTGRPRIAKCEGFYHGSYDYAEVSLGAGPAHWTEEDPVSLAYSHGTPQGVLDDVVVVPFNEPQHARRILEAHADQLACVTIDPTPWRVGSDLVRPEFVAMLRDFCDAHGVLLFFDEVVSYRLGPAGAQGVLGVRPDLTSLGKIIGGGFPVGAVAGREDVLDVFREVPGKGVRLPHGGTFNANPVTMTAGLAAMEAMTDDAFARLNALGEEARRAVAEVFVRVGIPGQVTGTGSLFRIHLHDRPLNTVRDSALSEAETLRLGTLRERLIDRGLFLGTGCIACLSTASRSAHVERLCDALTDLLPTLPDPASLAAAPSAASG